MGWLYTVSPKHLLGEPGTAIERVVILQLPNWACDQAMVRVTPNGGALVREFRPKESSYLGIS